MYEDMVVFFEQPSCECCRARRVELVRTIDDVLSVDSDSRRSSPHPTSFARSLTDHSPFSSGVFHPSARLWQKRWSYGRQERSRNEMWWYEVRGTVNV